MTKKRYYCDDGIEYRSYGIFDLSKADKSMDDFRDEDGICSWQFGNYLVDETDSMLTGEEVVNRLNKQEEWTEKLVKELKNRKKLNNILEGFLLDKGYDFNDIIKFLQDRTEKGEEE